MNITNIRSRIMREMANYYSSPDAMQEIALDMLDVAMDGQIDIPDPSSPFMFLLEASATQAATACLKSESIAMERYPRLAQVYSHLYHHMADADYLDRYATPSRTIFTLVVPTKTLREHAVLDSEAGVSRVIIPKETKLTVAGLDWYLHYPIVIEVGANNIVHVRYDLTANTPLQDGLSNLLDYRIVNNLDKEELVIDIPVEQISLESITNPVSVSTGFSGVFSYTDEFYYVRAYHRWGAGEWVEMGVTQSDMVYDIDRPTVVVRVADQAIQAYVPDIYMTNNAIGNQIRIDIYTTKGPVSLNLMDYTGEDFTVNWRDLNVIAKPETQALTMLNDMRIFASETITSGRAGLTFEELKERVIYRSADKRASITYSELGYQLKDRGYSLARAKDTVKERLYICAKPIPAPNDTDITTPIGVRHAYVSLDSADTNYADVLKSNYGRVTLTPSALFIESDGRAYPLPDVERRAIDLMGKEERVGLLNEGRHFFTPFFYVLDADTGLYSARTYYLDAGRRTSQSFLEANEGVPYGVNTVEMSVTRDDNRFIVRIAAEHPEGLERLHAQLTYTDTNNRNYSVRATQTTYDAKTSIFEFALISNLDVTPDDKLGFINMIGMSGNAEEIYTDLVDAFHIFYFRESVTPAPTNFDNYLVTEGLGSVVGITHESCRIRWGYSLPNMFSRTRAILTPPVYELHTQDVPAVYSENIPRRDENDRLVWAEDPVTGKPLIEFIHRKGDLVYADGVLQYAHRAGDPVELNGELVELEGERLIWEISPLLLDGRYRYATSTDAVAYRDSVGETIQGFLTNDLSSIIPTLMERTELRYQATASIGQTLVNVDGKQDLIMETGLAFTVNYMLSATAFKDISLRRQLIQFTKETLAEIVDSRTFSMGRTIEALMDGNNDVINVSVSNPIEGYEVARISGENMHFSIKPRLVMLTNGEVDVEDSIDISFTQESI